MRALKMAVIVMGVMLVVGFATLVAVIVGRVSRSGSTVKSAPAFAGRAIEIPHGARIEAMTAGSDRLVLVLALPEGDRRLLIIDLGSGAPVGTIELHSRP